MADRRRFWIDVPDGPIDLEAYAELQPEDQEVFKGVLAFLSTDAENFLSHEIGRPLGMSGHEVDESLDRLAQVGLVTVRSMAIN